MHYTTIFIDLDDTLYSRRSGLWDVLLVRIDAYMRTHLGLPAEEIPRLRRMYYENYGTTLRGLQIHHQVDIDDYMAYVHDAPVKQYLQPSPQLRQILLSLPQRRFIFTNADVAHAQRVMDALDVQGCFDGVIDLRATGFVCKPLPEAYRVAMRIAADPDPRGCILLDDSIRNLAPAHALGITTVWVNEAAASHPAADYRIADLLEMPVKLPFLWAQNSRITLLANEKE